MNNRYDGFPKTSFFWSYRNITPTDLGIDVVFKWSLQGLDDKIINIHPPTRAYTHVRIHIVSLGVKSF